MNGIFTTKEKQVEFQKIQNENFQLVVVMNLVINDNKFNLICFNLS